MLGILPYSFLPCPFKTGFLPEHGAYSFLCRLDTTQPPFCPALGRWHMWPHTVFWGGSGDSIHRLHHNEELTTPYMSNTYHQQNELVSVMLEDNGKAEKILTSKEMN